MMTLRQVVASAVLVLLCSVAVQAGATASEVCGDVNETGTVSTVDALMVLKSAVGHPIPLVCPAIDRLAECSSQLVTCTGDLSSTNADLADCLSGPVCGNGLAEVGEDCDGADLNNIGCDFGGPLRCAPGCTFDTTACLAERFDATGNTILDHETGLEWEKKTGTATKRDLEHACPGGPNCGDPHDVNNVYSWGNPNPPYEPSGSAYTDFLARLNGSADGHCYEGHCDWRLPTIEELERIAVPGCGAARPCVVDSSFLPSQSDDYWSSSTDQDLPNNAWLMYFYHGYKEAIDKTNNFFVRAVRSRS